MRRILWGTAALLLGAVALQILAEKPRPHTLTSAPKLAESLPTEIPGWSGHELPLAETEELKQSVEKTLRFDDVFTRRYVKGVNEISIYVAYWTPGKVPPRSVGVHTPDTCWVQHGWTRLNRDHAVSLRAKCGELSPAERGTYVLRGNVQHVLFWHLVGGKPYSYEQNGLHSLTASLQDLFTFGLNQRQEQLFVRIASDRPFEEFWADPGLQTLFTDLAQRGLVPSHPG